MAEGNTTVHIAENSAEQVAYKLLETIAAVEGKTLYRSDKGMADRDWILSTYVECIKAVKQHIAPALSSR